MLAMTLPFTVLGRSNAMERRGGPRGRSRCCCRWRSCTHFRAWRGSRWRSPPCWWADRRAPPHRRHSAAGDVHLLDRAGAAAPPRGPGSRTRSGSPDRRHTGTLLEALGEGDLRVQFVENALPIRRSSAVRRGSRRYGARWRATSLAAVRDLHRRHRAARPHRRQLLLHLLVEAGVSRGLGWVRPSRSC